MLKQWRLSVFGVVQGVCLRMNVRVKARLLNLSGYVRNMPDGSVEIRAQGQEADLRRLQRWLMAHPGAAQISRILKREESPEAGQFADFQIMY